MGQKSRNKSYKIFKNMGTKNSKNLGTKVKKIGTKIQEQNLQKIREQK
jgi:hypothetical protein